MTRDVGGVAGSGVVEPPAAGRCPGREETGSRGWNGPGPGRRAERGWRRIAPERMGRWQREADEGVARPGDRPGRNVALDDAGPLARDADPQPVGSRVDRVLHQGPADKTAGDGSRDTGRERVNPEQGRL